MRLLTAWLLCLSVFQLVSGCSVDGDCPVGKICTDSGECVQSCPAGWGRDINNCYPQDAILECSTTGFKLSLTTTMMYESSATLQPGHSHGINANDENVGTFDENGDVIVDQNWNDIKDLKVTHTKDSINFEVKISADNPSVKINDITIHTTIGRSFKIVCSYSDKVDFKLFFENFKKQFHVISSNVISETFSQNKVLNPTKVQIVLEDGSLDVSIGTPRQFGTVENAIENEEIWSNSFHLNVFSDDQFTTKITSEEPISLVFRSK